MSTLYLECQMGAAGDMLMGALLELHPDKESFIAKMNSLNIPGVYIIAEKAVRCGITGTHVKITVDRMDESDGLHHHSSHTACAHHHHTGMHEISKLIEKLDLPDTVKEDSLAVYRIIAEAESKVHGCPIDHLHFHEVGTMDAVADIVGTSLLIHELAPEKIIASPVAVGSGTVTCAHGILPVPAPATMHILEGIPIRSGNIEAELCTPTGAALLKYFASDFKSLPSLKMQKIGYGMGTKQFPIANCVRAILSDSLVDQDEIIELVCNIDDMTSEDLAFAMDAIMEAGAVDVIAIPALMKKGRPGTQLSCMCHKESRDNILAELFKQTSTLGIREKTYSRYVLPRRFAKVETPFGPVKIKISEGLGVRHVKPEYDDLAAIARKVGRPLSDIRAAVEKALQNSGLNL